MTLSRFVSRISRPSTVRMPGTFFAAAEDFRAGSLFAAVALGPSADDALHRLLRLDLHPRGRPPLDIRRVEALGHDPFEALLLDGGEECLPVAGEGLRALDVSHRRDRGGEALLALAQRDAGEVLAVGPEEVERVEPDGSAAAELADLRLVLHVHARL